MLCVRSLSRLHVAATFELRRGECIAVHGPSGAGKSVLLRALADLDPNQGTVTLDGILRESIPAPLWRRQVTYVAPEPGWWADTVQDNFDQWGDAIALIEELGLSASCGTWNVQRLSSGEKQRLGLARALVLQSRVLLLDEATSALDPGATGLVEAMIAKRRSTGTGVIWSTHDSSQARRVASRIFVMNGGRIAEFAT
jgi:putative ABC transport system ATP-binding protein